MKFIFYTLLIILFCSFSVQAQKKKSSAADKKDSLQAATFNGLSFRSIGPALTSGRVVDFAVNPNNYSEYYVAVASGGVWKTTNAGITFTPLFDREASYSIGCVTLDPSNANVVWVGSGENNNQRSVAYGDGVYKSEDGGQSWKNVGLNKSEHIGMIAVDPDSSNIVFVAAYGPLWNSGGDRGIYRTKDGGKTWSRVLHVSEHTGFNEVWMDPRNSKVLYATAHQRQRKVFTYIGGGPESAVYKSSDGGDTWNKIMNGLPADTDLGRIALAISPVDPNYLYAIVEAGNDNGGLYASKNMGASWEKRSGFSTSGNYYQEIFCDPKNLDKIFAMDSYLKVSVDGGKTFKNLGERNKHVDNHVIWVNPHNTKHMLVGCDGGIYESYDGGDFWDFKANLPVVQFYKVALDNSFPFYNVYGGTQDNFSLGGPSRTTSANGIVNSDWFITNGGDGFESQADYVDSNIIYAESQYGGLIRYDKRNGEKIEIRPVEAYGDTPYRWNWDAPLLISRHDHKRLYFASNKIFRTDDRGNSWKIISPDLSRGIDRNKLTVMGKVWSVDAVAKNQSTDIYGQVTTIAESPLDQNLLFAGTDDGLIHVTTDGGSSWSKIDDISGVPSQTYVNMIIASAHDKNVAYAAFNHHRYGDFKPYLFKTSNGGKSWSAIQHNLPDRGSVYSISEDHVNPNLLFAGTEFGVYFSIDGGEAWVKLGGGLPTIAVRDMEIQQRDNDLVLATFGRGYYVLDDYTPLRTLKPEQLKLQAFISPVRKAWMYIESMPLGIRGKGFLGESYWSVPNPKPGSVFTYYLKDDLKTLKEIRQEKEKERIRIGEPVYYPALDSLRAEDIQPDPYLLFTISDTNGNVIRRLKGQAKKGMHRIIWDFRTDTKVPVSLTPFDESNVFSSPDLGTFVLPGTYTVYMSKFEDSVFTRLTEPVSFEIEALNTASLAVKDKNALYEFGKKVEELQRSAMGTNAYVAELKNKVKYMKEAALQTPGLETVVMKNLIEVDHRLDNIIRDVYGDASLIQREFEAPTSLSSRVGSIMDALISTTYGTTETFMNSYNDAAKQFDGIYKDVKDISSEIIRLENLLERNKAPYTPGRMPEWKR